SRTMLEDRTNHCRRWLAITATFLALSCADRPAEPPPAAPIRQALRGTIPPEGGTFTGTTSGESEFAPGCSGDPNTAPENVYAWTPAFSGQASISTCGAGTHYDTMLYVSTAADGSNQLVCVDDTTACLVADGQAVGSKVQLAVTAGVTYYIYVDGWASSAGEYSLTVEPPTPGTVLRSVPAQGGTFTGTTSGASNFAPGCSADPNTAPEHVYAWTPVVSGPASISTCGAGTNYDTTLYVSTAADGTGQL